nr:hypothetical protein [Angustibacter aerolatus]
MTPPPGVDHAEPARAVVQRRHEGQLAEGDRRVPGQELEREGRARGAVLGQHQRRRAHQGAVRQGARRAEHRRVRGLRRRRPALQGGGRRLAADDQRLPGLVQAERVDRRHDAGVPLHRLQPGVVLQQEIAAAGRGRRTAEDVGRACSPTPRR